MSYDTDGFLASNCANVLLGREIPEELAHKTDVENEFPAEMWKKLGEAG